MIVSRSKATAISRLIVACLFVLAFAARSAHALDPTRHISQYGHTSWRIRDGFLGARANAITQTADGYLWIGTDAGLVRFDGARFVRWTPPAGQQLPSPTVWSLHGARDGSLWIGTQAGLSHLVNQDLINYQAGRGSIISILEDRNGTVWIARNRSLDDAGPLCQVIGTGMRCYGHADGIAFSEGGRMVEDTLGNLWIASSTGLVCWKPGSFTMYTPSGLKSNQNLSGVTGLAANPDGSLWVGTGPTGPGLGLQQLVRGVWKPLVTPELDGSTLAVETLFLDREHGLWIGTSKQGMYRIHGGQADHFRSADGLSSDYVSNFYEDREGSLWVATTKGIDMLRDLRVATFSTLEGLSTEEVDSVLASRDGTVWIGGDKALDALHRIGVSSIQAGKDLPGTQVTSLFEDHAGQLWVGIDTTLSIYKNGRFSRIDRSDGSGLGMVTGITEDVERNVWVVANRPPRTLIRIQNLKVQEELSEPQIPPARAVAADPHGGIWLGVTNGDLARYRHGEMEIVPFKHNRRSDSWVNQLVVNADGAVIGATAFGLIGWKEGKQQTLTVRNGLPCDGVNTLVADGQGALWLYMQCGLVQIPGQELQRWWEQPEIRMQLRTYDTFDGVVPGLAPFQGAARSSDGRLWFANNAVLQMLDPAHLVTNIVRPPVHVEEVIADRTGYTPRDGLRLPPLTRDIEIDYTALSFVVPQKVRFRYRLEGHDSTWQNPGTRRQAFYTDLRPGPYTFRVIASNNDGLWNETGATFTFSVAPAYYQTAWFQAIAAGALLLTGWGAHRVRLWQLARRLRAQFEMRAADRARIAEELHDTLIQDLAALSLQAEIVDDQLPPEAAEAKHTLDTLRARMQRVVSDGRRGMTELHEGVIGSEDLADALSRAAQELRGPDGPSFHVVVQGEPRLLHPLVGDEVYRIAREALANAFRHAAAHRIDVEVSFTSDELRVRIHDDGRGVSDEVVQAGRPGHFGLQGMRKRAKNIGATLKVWSRVGVGTEVDVTVPGWSAFQRPFA